MSQAWRGLVFTNVVSMLKKLDEIKMLIDTRFQPVEPTEPTVKEAMSWSTESDEPPDFLDGALDTLFEREERERRSGRLLVFGHGPTAVEYYDQPRGNESLVWGWLPKSASTGNLGQATRTLTRCHSAPGHVGAPKYYITKGEIQRFEKVHNGMRRFVHALKAAHKKTASAEREMVNYRWDMARKSRGLWRIPCPKAPRSYRTREMTNLREMQDMAWLDYLDGMKERSWWSDEGNWERSGARKVKL